MDIPGKVMMEVSINLPHQYYPALGEFVFRCAQLEYQLQEMTWRAIDIDNKQGRVLTIGAPTKALRGMLLTITSTHSKERWVKNKTHVQEINSIVRQAK